MSILQKARLLSDAGQYDSCGPKVCSVDLQHNLGGIITGKAEHKNCKMLKTLMDNSCNFDCKYCTNRAGCSFQKARYEPKELSQLFMHLHKNYEVNGLFLSSGVAGDADRATERMIDAVRLLRTKYHFHGYIHFKVLPGVSRHLIQEAAEYSSRMSVNIEAPNNDALGEMSSTKDFKIDLLRRQAWLKRLDLPAGQSTQLILNEFSTDKEVLRMMKWEYEKLDLKRMYYSAFRPVANTPFASKKAESHKREFHLYNVDFLAREYGFSFKEFESIMEHDQLPHEDPKMALAKERFRDGPLELKDASYEDLIRVPGIGPKSARMIEQKKIIDLKDLRKMIGKRFEKASPFVSMNGSRQTNLTSF